MNTTAKCHAAIPAAAGAEGLLTSSWVRGIGPTYARRLVEAYGVGAVDMLRDNPAEAAAEVKGLSQRRAEEAADSLRHLPYSAELLMLLYGCGIGEANVEKIFDKYGQRAAEVIEADPYSMVEDAWRFSFFAADKIGRRMGIAPGDARRLRGALVGAVKRFADEGHLFAWPEEAAQHAAAMAGVDAEQISAQIDATVDSGRLIRSRGGLYLPVFYHAEKEGARRLAALARGPRSCADEEDIPLAIGDGPVYTQAQRAAIATLRSSRVAVLTGGPGTGKTTVLRGVIDLAKKEGKKVVLAAPTGRAAKRMSKLTGEEASTIHRLLGYRDGEGYSRRTLEADLVVIDEGSMMEQVLFNHLLGALKEGTRVIVVGDVDQLPAIGAGDVLRDLIESGVVAVAHLDENFRQSGGSLIAGGARAINAGEMPAVGADCDLQLISEPNAKAVHDRILRLVCEELPAERGIRPQDIVVVTPQQIGPLGARQLNADLQQALNPTGPALVRGGTTMRLGDPVMQTANSRERGVYNGETGRITDVDTAAQTLRVAYSDGRSSTYARSELSELVLAYATTVHKLQGSEVDQMVLVLTMDHKPMLYRNLLYTGVSRARQLCVLVGEEEALRYAIDNNPAATRNSNFGQRLRGNLQDAPAEGNNA